jgi:hypothetical protein
MVERLESNKESMRLLTELVMDLTASIISVSEEYTSTMAAAFDEVQVILKSRDMTHHLTPLPLRLSNGHR